jgi:hypothetical protein
VLQSLPVLISLVSDGLVFQCLNPDQIVVGRFEAGLVLEVEPIVVVQPAMVQVGSVQPVLVPE